MGRTQATEQQIKDRVLTGASFKSELGFYDETFNYSSGDSVIWNNEKYICNTNIIGTTEGDLSSAPDVAVAWDRQPNAKYSVYPTVAQTIGTSRIDLDFNTERYASPYFSLAGSEITALSSGTFLISVSLSSDNTANTRSSTEGYLQLDTGSGYADIPNYILNVYNRDSSNGKGSASILIPIDLSPGDKIKLQVISNNASAVQSNIDGCNITIFGLDTISGPRGSQGLAGPSGDLKWLGAYTSGTYNQYDTVEYQGSSYTCLVNGTTTAPPGTAGVDWDLVALKGANGAGANITVQDSGGGIPNTPHGTLNFTDDIVATDGGSGVANISVIFPKKEYMLPIWAEENAGLGTGNREWAFGNGANTPSGYGVCIYVPTGYKCELVAMSLSIRQGTATVEAVHNTTDLGNLADVDVSSGTNNTNDTFAPVLINDSDVIGFKTTSQSGTGGPNVITAWLKYTEL